MEQNFQNSCSYMQYLVHKLLPWSPEQRHWSGWGLSQSEQGVLGLLGHSKKYYSRPTLTLLYQGLDCNLGLWWYCTVVSHSSQDVLHLRWLVYTVMEVWEKSGYSTITLASEIHLFFSAINANVWAFLTDFCFHKTTPAQQGKVLRDKKNSEYI